MLRRRVRGIRRRSVTRPRTRRPLAGDHGHLAGEFAGVMGGDGAFAREIGLHDFHAAGEQNEERNVGIARLEQNFTGLNGPDFGDGPDAFDLRGGKNRKGLGACVQCAGYERESHPLSLGTRRALLPGELSVQEPWFYWAAATKKQVALQRV